MLFIVFLAYLAALNVLLHIHGIQRLFIWYDFLNPFRTFSSLRKLAEYPKKPLSLKISMLALGGSCILTFHLISSS